MIERVEGVVVIDIGNFREKIDCIKFEVPAGIIGINDGVFAGSEKFGANFGSLLDFFFVLISRLIGWNPQNQKEADECAGNQLFIRETRNNKAEHQIRNVCQREKIPGNDERTEQVRNNKADEYGAENGEKTGKK